MEKSVAVSLKNITKRFGSVLANDNVSLDIYKGEILAVLGENGSGKTTLMNMISGIYYPDEGSILVDGREVVIANPRDAFNYGIGMVHQHFKLVDVFSAIENITLGLDEKFNIKETGEKISNICTRYGFDINPFEKVYNMSVSEKQTVEIVKVLYRGADILILDEPTAVLTPQETEKLFNILRNMKKDGKAIVIITHKLHEVQSISDRVAILRKGAYIGDMITAESTAEKMTEMMVGRQVSLNIRRPDTERKGTLIEVNNLTVKNEEGIEKLKDVSFSVHAGEVLGIAGVSGSGQKELLETLAGLHKSAIGTAEFIGDDKRYSLIGINPRKLSELGVVVSFVPEDRLGMGLVGNMDICDNMMLRTYRDSKSIFADRKKPKELAKKVVEDLDVVTPDVKTPVRMLSGGNVQKVLLGREISMQPKALLTAYAVRGLDINSSYAIYDLINKQKENGVAVVFVGEDLDVLMELSDRILVLCDGHVSGIVDGRSADKNEIGLLMTKTGGKN